MAGENDLGGSVGLDITEFRANVNELNRQIRVVDSGFRAAAAGMDDWSKSQDGLQQRVAALNQITGLQAQKVANLTEMYERVALEQGANSRAAQELLVRLNRETEVLNQQRRELRDVTDQLDNFGSEQESVADSTEETTGALSKMSGALGEIGKVTAKAAAAGIVAVGAAVAGAIGYIVKFADDSTKAFNKFQAQTGATAEEMAEFREVAQDVYAANLGESIEDVAASMALVKQTTGQIGDALESTTKNALLMRDTFEFEVAESVNAANSMMKAFGITSEQAYTLMAQGAQNGANKNGDLIDVINEYSVHFAQLGLDAEQFTNVLIKGAESGAFTIDKVGDAVKEFGIRSKDESQASADAFKALGLDANQMFSAFASGGPAAEQAFQTVVDRLGSMKDPLKQNQAGVALFGTMFEDLGASAIAALGGVGDQADMTASTLDQIAQAKFGDLGSAFEGLKRQALGALQPVTDSATNMIGGIVTGIQNGDWASVATAVATGIGEMAGQLAEMLPELSSVATTIIGSLAGAITSAIPTVLPAVVETVIALITTIVQVISDNGPMLITAAVQAIMTLIEGLVSALPELVKVAIELIKSLADGIIDALPGLIDAAVEIILTLVDGILNLLPELIPVAIDIIMQLVKGIINAIPRLVKAVPKIVKSIVDTIVNNLPMIIKAAIDLVITLVKALIENLPMLIEAGVEILQAVIKGILSLLVELPKIAWDVFKTLLNAFLDINWGELGKNIVSGLWNGLKNMDAWLNDKIKGWCDDFIGSIKGFLGIHSPSRVMMELGKYTAQGFALGIVGGKKQVFKSAEELAKAVYDASKDWIDERKYYNQLSLQEELQAWQYLSAKYKKGTEERKEADREVYRLKQEIAAAEREDQAEQFEASKKWIEKRKDLNTLSLTQELTSWERVQARYKQGTKEREEAEKNIIRVKQEIYKQLNSLAEDYLSKTKEVNTKLIAEEKRLTEAYDKAVSDRASSIYSFAGLFDEVSPKEDVSGETLLENLRGQLYAMQTWSQNLKQLAARGVEDGLIAELEKMGPGASAEIEALTKLTDGQLGEYQALWKWKHQLARQQATAELEGLKEDTQQQLRELREAANTQLNQLTSEFNAKIKQIRSGTTDEFNAMTAAMPEIGNEIINGLITGMNQMEGELLKTAKSMAESVSKTIKKSLGIKSPSRVMRDEVGKMIGAGISEGISASARDVNAAMQQIGGQVSGTVSASGGTAGAGSTENNYNFSGLFSGAQIVIQSDDDYETIGDKVIRTLTDKVARTSRGTGLNPA